MDDNEKALQEMRDFQDARRDQEMRDLDISLATIYVTDRVSEDMLKSWKIVESLIAGQISEAYIDIVRKKLSE